MIKFYCEKCGAKIGVEDRLAGRRVKCPKCAEPNTVPGTAPTPEAVPAAKSAVPRAQVQPEPPSPPAQPNIFANAAEVENDASFELNQVAPVRYEPRPAPQRTQRAQPQGPDEFGLHPVIIVGVVLVLGSSFLSHLSDFNGGDPSRVVGFICGEVIGGILFSVGAAFVVFKCGVKSRVMLGVTFCLMSALTSAGVAMRASDQHKRNEGDQALLSDLQKSKQVIDEHPGDDSVRDQERRRMADSVERAQATGGESNFVKVMAEFTKWQASVKKPYLDAQQRFEAVGGADVSTVKSRENLTARIAALAAWNAAWFDYNAQVRDVPARVREMMDRTTMSQASKDQAVEKIKAQPTAMKLPRLLDLDYRGITLMQNIFKLYLDEWSNVVRNSEGYPTFRNQAAQAKYRGYLEELSRVSTESETLLHK